MFLCYLALTPVLIVVVHQLPSVFWWEPQHGFFNKSGVCIGFTEERFQRIDWRKPIKFSFWIIRLWEPLSAEKPIDTWTKVCFSSGLCVLAEVLLRPLLHCFIVSYSTATEFVLRIATCIQLWHYLFTTYQWTLAIRLCYFKIQTIVLYFDI